MSQTHTVSRDPAHDPGQAASHDQVTSPEVHHKRHLSHFWRHFLEMLAVMLAGMITSGAILVTIVRMNWNETTLRYPVQSLLIMAAGMTVPMVVWMRHRGHGWRSSAEMAAAMVVPVIPFLCLVWFNVSKSALCGVYCALTVPAMLALMLYRRREYAMEM